MCLPITLCCFFSSKYKLAFFQMLLSHWSIKIWLISPPYLRGLLNTFPKWYDTWNSDENWAFYGQKTEELCFCQKFWKNFRGLFGALKLEIFLKKRYFGVTLDRHYPILRSKSKSKKLTAHWLFFGPLYYLYCFPTLDQNKISHLLCFGFMNWHFFSQSIRGNSGLVNRTKKLPIKL